MQGPFPPVHAGEVLSVEFLTPNSLTPYALARELNLPRTRIERLVRGQTGMTADTALRLSRFFSTSPEFWMNLQSNYELTTHFLKKKKELEGILPQRKAA